MSHKLQHLLLPDAKPTTFLNDCLRLMATVADLNDYVEHWHENNSKSVHPDTLQGFLGFSDQEYETWRRDPAAATAIVESCRAKQILVTA